MVEFYQSRMETDTLKMIKDQVLSKDNYQSQTEYSSKSLDLPVVSHMSYVLTVDIKALALTQTISHVTAKMLVAVTKSD